MGVESDDPDAPGWVDLARPTTGLLVTALRSALGGSAQVLRGMDLCGRPAAGRRRQSRDAAMALPLRAGLHHAPWGVLLLGADCQRALDDDYQQYFVDLAGVIGRNIGAWRALESARQRATALSERDRAKTAFFSNVSHEFRTPLTLLLGPVEDTLEDPQYPLEGVHRQRLQIAHRNALRIKKLVNGLLDFSRIEEDRLQARFQPTDLATATAELASNFRAACDQAGLTLHVDCPPLPEPVYVDRDMWEKIVLNLLSNAFKYTLHGSIYVSQHARSGCLELTIRDTGVGIASEAVPRIFERFHRIENALGRTQEGSGIGLALVRELVRLHGGEVQVESRPAWGSTFSVRIPLGHKHLPRERVDASHGLTFSPTGASPFVAEALRWLPNEPAPAMAGDGELLPELAEVDGRRRRILIVDDNADMRDFIGRLLGQRYNVTAVADGLTALQAACADPPDLIVTDILLPRLDGITLLRRLREDAATRELPVLVLSARSGEEAREEGLRAGADDYLTKPFRTRELLAHVSAHLKLAQLRREAAEVLREADRRKTEFLALLAHELRNPLAPIRTGLELIRLAGDDPAVAREVRTMMERQSRQMTRLIDDLLDISRVSQGKFDLRRRRIHLRDVLDSALEAAQWAVEEAGHRLEIDIADRQIELDGDPERLAQVFANLIHNAAKYTPQGGRIRLVVQPPVGGTVTVSVSDSGRGIPSYLFDRIFEMFSQIPWPEGGPRGGLGLGLTLVKSLVELHNGSVEVESPGENRGSTFHVRLPVLDEAPADTPTEPMMAPMEPHSRRLLVVDDNQDAARALCLMLKMLGNEVRAAYDGLEALETAAEFRPEVILLDLGMPKLNGCDAARQIRQQPWGKDVVLIALTGWGQPQDKQRTREAGFDYHVVKPVEPPALEQILAEIPRSGEARTEGEERR
jgi:signal transduction histidine kinase